MIRRTLFAIVFLSMGNWSPHSLLAAEEDNVPEENTSHFVDTLEPTVTLPIGTELLAARSFLKKKVRLRKEVKKKVFPPENELSSIFAGATLVASRPILASQVSSAVPLALQHLLPPRRVLVTIIEENEYLKSVSLCTPYDRVSLKSVANSDERNSSLQILTTQARVLSHRLDYDVETSIPSVVVLAVRHDLVSQLNTLRWRAD